MVTLQAKWKKVTNFWDITLIFSYFVDETCYYLQFKKSKKKGEPKFSKPNGGTNLLDTMGLIFPFILLYNFTAYFYLNHNKWLLSYPGCLQASIFAIAKKLKIVPKIYKNFRKCSTFNLGFILIQHYNVHYNVEI